MPISFRGHRKWSLLDLRGSWTFHLGWLSKTVTFLLCSHPETEAEAACTLTFPTSFQPMLCWTTPEITPNNCQWCLHLFLSPVRTIPSRDVMVPMAFPLHLGNIGWVKLALYAHRPHHTSYSWDVEFYRKNVHHQLVLINWKQLWLPVLGTVLGVRPIQRWEALPGKKLFIHSILYSFHSYWLFTMCQMVF